LIVNRGPKAVATHLGASLELAAGNAVAVSTGTPGRLTGSHHIGLVLPREALATRVEDLDGALMRTIPSTAEPLQMLIPYIDLLQYEAPLRTPEFRHTIANHIHDLVALVLGANRDTRQGGLHAAAAARLAAALADLGKSFAQPGLRLPDVARRQGVSTRYLQQ